MTEQQLITKLDKLDLDRPHYITTGAGDIFEAHDIHYDKREGKLFCIQRVRGSISTIERKFHPESIVDIG
jgi:hypothetical protein